MNRARAALALLAVLFVLMMHGAALAHKPSDSYLRLSVDGAKIAGQWDIALRDLDFAIGLDGNQDNAITWGEVKAKHKEIAAYALSRLVLGPKEAPCPPVLLDQLVDNHSDGAYTVLRFTATCPTAATQLTVDYRLFFDIDPQHRGLLNLSSHGANRAAILSAEEPVQQFALEQLSMGEQFVDYLKEGVAHIWSGFDHFLFLITLLLGTSVLARTESLGPILVESVKVVTAFTLSHSITLGLAALGIIQVPIWLAESLIAVTIVAAAINNIWPFLSRRIWLVALAFGFIHGIGFANVLLDLGLPRGSLLLALLGFNSGVELGQLAIVAAAFPVLALTTRQLRGAGMAAANLAIAAIGIMWFSDRALGTALMAF